MHVLIIVMTRSVHVQEIDQVHEYDFSDNVNVTVIVYKDENGLEKYFKYLEIVCERSTKNLKVD